MAAGGTYEPITNTTIASATQSVTFSSIPQTYTGLIVVINGVQSGGNTSMYFRYNGDAGTNYGGKTDLTTSGALNCGLDDIVSGLTLFENTEEYEIDFILMGSANYEKEDAHALANKDLQNFMMSLAVVYVVMLYCISQIIVPFFGKKDFASKLVFTSNCQGSFCQKNHGAINHLPV